jgi:uncharacterized membrane protein YkoI
MKHLIVLVVAAMPMLAAAKDLPCSVKASRLDADTKRQAKVDDKAARAAAIAEVKAAGARIASGGLEVEDGCLVYSFDVKIPNRSGVQEILIDAGSGKVLSVEHESPAKEAAEKALDKVKKKP